MKKQLALLITLFTAIGINAFADGYVEFDASKSYVWDEFTTPGTGVVAPGDVTVTFLWALVGTPDPLGSSVPTNGISNVGNGWSTVSSMISSGWNIAEDASNGNAEADVADNPNGPVKGGFGYGSGPPFPLAGTIGGDTYEIVVIGWDNLTGATTLENAMSGNVPMAWSNGFDYTTGATLEAPVLIFSTSGMNPFGVAPVPEPATLTLAGLGWLSVLLIRRKS